MQQMCSSTLALLISNPTGVSLLYYHLHGNLEYELFSEMHWGLPWDLTVGRFHPPAFPFCLWVEYSFLNCTKAYIWLMIKFSRGDPLVLGTTVEKIRTDQCEKKSQQGAAWLKSLLHSTFEFSTLFIAIIKSLILKASFCMQLPYKHMKP